MFDQFLHLRDTNFYVCDFQPTRWNLVCCLCKIKQGAPIQCHVKTCKTAFHVTCAFEKKLDMRTEVDEEDDDEENASVHLQVSSDPQGNFIVRFLRLRPAKLKHLICVRNTQLKSYMLSLTECVLESRLGPIV